MQRAIIYSVQRVAVTPPLPPVTPPFPPARPRVNVYLCIKQALFIRPMNMHCFEAVARCRVQTRRYHCLINHIQSHRFTLCPHFPFSPCSTRVSRSPLSSSPPPSRRGPCHPSELSARSPSSRVLSHSPLPSLPSAVHSSAVPLSPTGRN